MFDSFDIPAGALYASGDGGHCISLKLAPFCPSDNADCGDLSPRERKGIVHNEISSRLSLRNDNDDVESVSGRNGKYLLFNRDEDPVEECE